ncbi:WD40 repeat domain-containing protein [Actinocrispum sp. NPDC049592]|uniref:WD40 repeat domain-containing protein n=1 Tax=Actinocrispum sp. NPDC049592 TaxID=3154835 RepID=UPI0034166063
MIDEFLHWLYTSLGPGVTTRGRWRATCYHYLELSQEDGDAIVDRGKELGLLTENQHRELYLTPAGVKYVQDRLPPGTVPELVHTFGPHSSRVAVMGFVGTQFVTASVDGVVRWWDPVSGEPVRSRSGDPFSDAGVTPDGSLIVFNGGDRMLWIWDAATGSQIRSPFRVGALGTLAFSADGKVVAINNESDLHVVRIPDGQPIAVLATDDMIVDAALSSDGRLAAFVTQDQSAMVWDTSSAAVVAEHYVPQPMRVVFSGDLMATCGDELALGTTSIEVPGHPSSMAFSPDGTVIATGCWDGTIQFWSVADRRRIRAATAKHHNTIWQLSWSPDGTMLASCDGTARLWDPRTGDPLQEPVPGDMDGIAFAPDGGLLATRCRDHTVKLWRTIRPTLPDVIELPAHDEDIAAIAFSLDSSMFMSASEDGVVRWWDVGKNHVIDAKAIEPFEEAAFSPNGCLLATNDMDHNLWLWAADTGDALREPFDVEIVGSLVFSADGGDLAVTQGDTVTVWTVPDGQRVGAFRVGGEDIEDHALSPDGSLLGAVSPHEIRLWHTRSGALIASARREGWLTRVLFSPDGRTMVACGIGEITWWDSKTGGLRSVELPGRACPVAASFSLSGILATGDDDGLIQFWRKGSLIAESAERHDNDVWQVAWSDDATLLASSGGDGTVRLWDTTTGARLQMFDASVDALAFAPDGSLLAGQGRDNIVRFWETAP